jgi:hypothetical protein
VSKVRFVLIGGAAIQSHGGRYDTEDVDVTAETDQHSLSGYSYDRTGCLPDPAADRYKGVAPSTAPQLVGGGDDQTRCGCTRWMTERDGPAVDVCPLSESLGLCEVAVGENQGGH